MFEHQIFYLDISRSVFHDVNNIIIYQIELRFFNFIPYTLIINMSKSMYCKKIVPRHKNAAFLK